jgi:hypothetical protein
MIAETAPLIGAWRRRKRESDRSQLANFKGADIG